MKTLTRQLLSTWGLIALFSIALGSVLAWRYSKNTVFYPDTVIRISALTEQGTIVGTGTVVGTYEVITAGHLCAPGIPFLGPFTFANSTRRLTVVRVDEKLDLCLLRSDTPFAHTLRFAVSQQSLGEEVRAVGYPFGVPVTIITLGTYAGYIFDEGLVRYMFSCRANRGNSGGPILNASNEIIGIIVEVMGHYDQLTIAVTPLDVQLFLTQE